MLENRTAPVLRVRVAGFSQILKHSVAGKPLIGDGAIDDQFYHCLHPYMCLQVHTPPHPGTRAESLYMQHQRIKVSIIGSSSSTEKVY